MLLMLDPSLSRLQLYGAVCLLELQRADLERLKRAAAKSAGQPGASASAAATVQDLRSLLQRAAHTLRFEDGDGAQGATEGARMAEAVRRAQQELEAWARGQKTPAQVPTNKGIS